MTTQILKIDDILEGAQRMDGTGFCTACGHESQGVEPDACGYECENCGQAKAFGAEELCLMGVGI